MLVVQATLGALMGGQQVCMADEHGKGPAGHRIMLLCIKRGKGLQAAGQQTACVSLHSAGHQNCMKSNRAEVSAEIRKLWSCLQRGQGSMQVSCKIFNPKLSAECHPGTKERSSAFAEPLQP